MNSLHTRVSKLFLSVVLISTSFLSGCALFEKKESSSAPKISSRAPRYTSPEETFESWRQAAIQLDLEALVNSYAKDAQPGLRQEINSSTSEALKAMQRETRETEFAIEKIVYENNRAYLRVKRKINKSVEIEVLTMTKEESGWKLLP